MGGGVIKKNPQELRVALADNLGNHVRPGSNWSFNVWAVADYALDAIPDGWAKSAPHLAATGQRTPWMNTPAGAARSSPASPPVRYVGIPTTRPSAKRLGAGYRRHRRTSTS